MLSKRPAFPESGYYSNTIISINSSGNHTYITDSVRFSCNIQVPDKPKIIEPLPNYWKLNDTVINLDGGVGIGYPNGTSPYYYYQFSGKYAGGHKMFLIRLVDPRSASAQNTTAFVRVGKQFTVQLYSGANNDPRDTSYRSADTTNSYAAFGNRSGSPTFSVPEIWVYRWNRDASGNSFQDSVHFSCAI